MAEGRRYPGVNLPGRPVLSVGEETWLWGWVLFSAVLHVGFVFGFWALPYAPARRPSYPVYTVDLVGGEKIGGPNLNTQPVLEAKAKSKSLEEKPPASAQKKQNQELKTVEKLEKSVKKEKVKPSEKALETKEGITFRTSKKEKPTADSKKEAAEASQAGKELPAQVREKLLQAALDRLKERNQPPPSSKGVGGGQAAPSSGPGEGQGAASLGSGGTGGGIVKGIEFVNYYNRMRQLIKQRWTWGGKKADLEMTVRFGIQENGEIVGIRVTRASGDLSYDETVIRAVTRANPLPPPPESYRKDFMDVELTFRPEDLRS